MVEDDGSRSGSYLNGRIFQREELVLGDILKIGPFSFRFDGTRFVETFGTTGAVIEAWMLSKAAGATNILDAVTLRVETCQFVGVIGPSGAGKSTLLDALCALRPADSGQVTVDGVDIYRHYEFLRDSLGYVPQDDIVPLELPVEEALYCSARLMPSASTQAVMDASLFWGKKITGGMRVDCPTAFSNLNRGKSLRNGQIYQNPRPAVKGLAALLVWTIATSFAAWLGIRGKERG